MSEAAPITTTLREAGQLPVALVGGKARSLGVLLDAAGYGGWLSNIGQADLSGSSCSEESYE